eukprot:4743597-Amphidinium_carterae.1
MLTVLEVLGRGLRGILRSLSQCSCEIRPRATSADTIRIQHGHEQPMNILKTRFGFLTGFVEGSHHRQY